MKRKNIISVDQKTGEILEGITVYCGVKRNPYSKGWIMNSQEGLKVLAEDEDISKEALRILIFLMAYLDFENWIQVPQKIISEKLNIKKSNVSRGISLLESKQILLRGPKLGRSYSFRLNPNFGWKGDVLILEKYRKEKEKERIEDLKNKTNKKRQKKLKELSKKFSMSFEELQEIQNELNLT